MGSDGGAMDLNLGRSVPSPATPSENSRASAAAPESSSVKEPVEKANASACHELAAEDAMQEERGREEESDGRSRRGCSCLVAGLRDWDRLIIGECDD